MVSRATEGSGWKSALGCLTPLLYAEPASFSRPQWYYAYGSYLCS